MASHARQVVFVVPVAARRWSRAEEAGLPQVRPHRSRITAPCPRANVPRAAAAGTTSFFAASAAPPPDCLHHRSLSRESSMRLPTSVRAPHQTRACRERAPRRCRAKSLNHLGDLVHGRQAVARGLTRPRPVRSPRCVVRRICASGYGMRIDRQGAQSTRVLEARPRLLARQATRGHDVCSALFAKSWRRLRWLGRR